MKTYEPFPMMMQFKRHQGVKKGDIITENVGGVIVKYKVMEIKSFRSITDDLHEILMTVREFEGPKKNKHGKTILERCEICQGKMTPADKEKYGHECQGCVDHLKGLLGRAIRRDGGKSE